MPPLIVVPTPDGTGMLDATLLAAPEPELEHALTRNAMAPSMAPVSARTDERDLICTNLSE